MVNVFTIAKLIKKMMFLVAIACLFVDILFLLGL